VTTQVQEAPPRFWQPGFIEKPEIKKGMMSDWAARAFINFAGRPLSYMDLAKVLYSEYADDEPDKAKVLARHALTSKRVGRLLAINSLQLRWVDVNYTGHVESRVVSTSKPHGSVEVLESQRPDDKELYTLAVALRLGWDETTPDSIR
jgi:hypothetical protein